ncbi:hypothetical protein CERSUDRAFT_116545 [Gelatoporia subvermispora B]|uniref:Uncharacterized protein n=1 Tax=Ceriporiopsis subvermispora (strain B) TaxID=914234 RepID=M2QDC4_CERS8|nr:hypothetical protein CERSUDRAFT_116545 [Gelatoporia subvermispora B]
MFSKAVLVAFLSLSLSALAAPNHGFGGQQEESCGTAITTVTVTAAPAASSLAAVSTGGSKGSNNASGGGAAGNNASNKGGNNNNKGGNNNNGATVSAAASSSAAASAASSAAASSSTAASASNSGNSSDSGDIQSSLTLDPSVIATGFENNGQDVPAAGQVASLTSSNNFINFCATVPNLPITNGQQIKTGSCNPAPMGIIAATTNMPSAKFTNPKNLDTVPANTNFTISMAIRNLDTGFFVNADENFFSAPQQTGSTGNIQGHSHVVIENIDSLTSTTPTDPTTFAFFKGLNDPAANGVLTATVDGGLPAGTYRLASINTAANHQPALVAIAQHGTLDDMVYFTVSDNATASGGNNAAQGGAAGNAAASSSAAASAASASAAAGKAGQNAQNGQKGQNGQKAQNGQKGAKKGRSVMKRRVQLWE